jgi:hypothetical protein
VVSLTRCIFLPLTITLYEKIETLALKYKMSRALYLIAGVLLGMYVIKLTPSNPSAGAYYPSHLSNKKSADPAFMLQYKDGRLQVLCKATHSSDYKVAITLLTTAQTAEFAAGRSSYKLSPSMCPDLRNIELFVQDGVVTGGHYRSQQWTMYTLQDDTLVGH